MPGATPQYALPYQAVTDPPHGPNLGQDLAEAVEAEIVRIDAAAAAVLAPYRAVQTLAATTPSITFNAIPATLKNLTLHWTARSSDPGFAAQQMCMRINGNTGNNYRIVYHQVGNSGGVATSAVGLQFDVPDGHLGLLASNGAIAGVFGSGVAHIPAWNAPHTNHLGWTHQSIMVNANTGYWLHNAAGTYTGAGPYNSITVYPLLGSFLAGTQVTLLGWGG